MSSRRETFTRCAVAFDHPEPIELMASRRPTLQEEVHLRALRLVDANPRISQRDLASRVGISVGAAHYCLAALAKKGLIKLGDFSTSKSKRKYVYILTPEGLSTKAALTVGFLRRKVAEYEALRAEIEALKIEVDNYKPQDKDPNGP